MLASSGGRDFRAEEHCRFYRSRFTFRKCTEYCLIAARYLAIVKKAINEMLECCTQERIDKIDGDINRIAALVEARSQDSTLGLKLNELLEEKEKIAAKELQAKHLEEVIDSFQQFLANGEIKEFTPEINRKFIEKLMVYQDKVIVHMIGGMEVEINK